MRSLLNMALTAGLMPGCQYSQVVPQQGSYMAAQINGTDWLVEINTLNRLRMSTYSTSITKRCGYRLTETITA